MKEIKKITIIMVALLILPAILGIIVNNSGAGNKIKADHNSPITLVNYTEEQIQEIENKQLKSGNFSSLQGNWKSGGETVHTRLAIEGSILFLDGKRYFLSYGGMSEAGVPYLNTHSDNAHKNTAKLTFYPKGSIIPVRLENGEIDTTGQYDSSDRKKDRLLFSQTILNEKELLNNVCYQG